MPSRWTKWYKEGEPIDLPNGEYIAQDRWVYTTENDKLTRSMESRYRPMEESDGS